ncbi:MAG: hypothetical protein R3B81_04650 [bacterium]
MRFSFARVPWIAALGLAAALSGCRDAPVVESRWNDRPRDDEGRVTNWAGATMRWEDRRLTLGALNDDTALQIYLYPESEATAAALLSRGFSLFVGDGESVRQIRFLPDPAAGSSDRRLIEKRRDGAPPRRRTDLALRLTNVELVNARDEVVDAGVGSIPGIRLLTNRGDYGGSVQVRLDLVPGAEGAFGLGVAPGDEIEIALVTPDAERHRPDPSRRRTYDETDEPTDPGARPDSREEFDRRRPEPLQLTARVRLAAPESTSTSPPPADGAGT